MPSHFASTCATRTSDVSTGSMLPTSVATWKMTPRCAVRMSLGAFDLSRIDPAGYVRWLIRYHQNASFFSSPHNKKDGLRHGEAYLSCSESVAGHVWFLGMGTATPCLRKINLLIR